MDDATASVPDLPAGPQEAGTSVQGPAGISTVKYARVYQAEKPRLVRFLIRCGANRHDADDAAQRALAGLFEQWETVRNPRSWLRKVALREFTGASSTNERRLEGHDQLSIPSDPSDIESLLEQDAVLSAIRQLPPLQRQVFALHFDHLSTREIAETLQITEAAVRQNLARTRARLKELLGLSDPFDKFARDVESDPLMVLLARWRRSAVIKALKDRPDVVEVIPSGSLARGTHLGPIHDVDLIVVFDDRMHLDWHGGGSAQAALEHLRTAVRETMQAGLERPFGLVHDTELRNHVVKCDLDPSLGPLDAVIPDAPPVDVMPTVREGSHLRVPERLSDSWIDVDPERLMRMVAARQRAWSNFDEVVRMIKDWADHQGLKMKSLAAEVLVLKYLPRPGLFETLSCSDAIAGFFEAASRDHITSLVDPAGRCGEIDPRLNFKELREALDYGAEQARLAVEAEQAWPNRHLAEERINHPSVYWQEIFGSDRFKRPRVWYWNPRFPAEQPAPESRHWFDEFAEPADESAWSWRPWHYEPPGPRPAGPADWSPESRGPDVPGEADERWPDGPEPASPERILGSSAQDVPVTPSLFGPGAGSGPGGPPPRGPAPGGPQEGGSGPAGPGGGGPRDGGFGPGSLGPHGPARRRYLKGQCPESIPVGKPFSLVVSIILAAGPSSAELEPFDVPPEGRDVLLVLHAPGLRLLGDQRQPVHVPAEGDSKPVMFELRADAPGARSVSITAWLGGSYLGELIVEITAERDHPAGPHRDVLAEISTEPAEGAVSLVVRYDPAQNAYRFEFRDVDNSNEVISKLAYEPGPRVEQLLGGLDKLAKGHSGYSADQTQDYLINAGAALWRELVPQALREQFWDRQRRIRQLTILADKDAVPWELLYPRDPGHDAGFLVEQFPVTRAIFGRRLTRRLTLWPARFVLPEGSLPGAHAEIDAMQRLLDPGQSQGTVISSLTPLQELIRSGDFGLLHFACHNRFDPADGSSITLDNVQFTPTLLTTASIDRVLAQTAPTIFMNACRSAGVNATYNRLDGWASKFLEAGAAAFIGSLWAVSDGAAREFAQELYSQLQTGSSLGEAVMRARQAARRPDDPTWLAYTIYGEPGATVSQRP